MNRFIKFFTGKASTEEELELMKWAKESKANEDELLRSLRWFQTVDLLSDEEGRKRLRFPVWVRYVSVAAVMFVCGIFISQWLEYGSEKLAAMQEITVPGGQHIDLVLTDGTEVWLNSLTTLKYDPMFERDSRTVYLDGEAYFEVAKDAARPFTVVARGVEVEVLGTHFNVNAYPEKNGVVTTLAEGKVRVAEGGHEAVLMPGEQAVASAGALDVREVDVSEYISWKDGLFVFRQMPLEQIMEQVYRWYGVKAAFFDESARTETFTGVIDRSMSAEAFFDVIEKVLDVQFKMGEGNQVAITAR